jgi:acyl-coenzyme A synthetase/AMP-(fatty) acid ligase
MIALADAFLLKLRALLLEGICDYRNSATTTRFGLAAELREWCKSRLQRYQYPHRIEFVDHLPRTATGKIERFRLREQSWQS